MGTLAELRAGHAADEKLEEIFLALTGERAARAALDILDA
jgi:hypothetical protein